MDARAIIAKLRRHETLEERELKWFANGLASGLVSDAQAGAFAMAVCLNGLGGAGRTALTKAMTANQPRGRLSDRWTASGAAGKKTATLGTKASGVAGKKPQTKAKAQLKKAQLKKAKAKPTPQTKAMWAPPQATPSQRPPAVSSDCTSWHAPDTPRPLATLGPRASSR